MTTKQSKLPVSPSDELIIRAQLAAAKIDQPFHDFVRSTLGWRPFDYNVVFDQIDNQGWRVIELKVFAVGDTYLSSIFLPPGAVNRFPPALDIPF